MTWLNEHRANIAAYADAPKALDELQAEARQAPMPGYDIHHIVEQTPARQDGFQDWQIEALANRVLVPRYRHWEISGWYSSKLKDFGWMSPRDYLRGSEWTTRENMGLDTLVLFDMLRR